MLGALQPAEYMHWQTLPGEAWQNNPWPKAFIAKPFLKLSWHDGAIDCSTGRCLR